MPVTAQSIVDKAQIILQDTTAIRWAEAELLGWLNDGQREIATLRPDSTNVQTTLTTVAGAKQTLPTNATALVEVLRTVGGAAIRKEALELMDTQRPGWYSDAAAAAKHFMYDPRTPRVFHIWPPSAGGAPVEVKYQSVPVDVTLAQAISLGDEFVNALLDYVLFRAYQKDADFSPNDARVIGARQSFENTLGLKAAADAAAAPGGA
jgi:hypothetical protein